MDSKIRKVIGSRALEVLTLVAAATGLIGTLFSGALVNPNDRVVVIPELIELQSRVNSFSQTIAAVDRQLNEIKKLLVVIDKLPTGRLQQVPVAKLQISLEEIDKRMKSLESGLITNPEKALALPLLRQDLNSFREQHQRDVAALSSDMTRVYDISKWVLGLIAAAVLGLSVSNIFGKKT